MGKEKIEKVVFISYTHDSQEHKDWVLQLATRLRSNGVNILLDQWNLRLGSDLAAFMERGLSESSRVICVCSETYVTKTNTGKGGAGYEKQIITSELITDQNRNWVIPLVRNNKGNKKLPTFLSSKLYISFEDNRLYEANYLTLLRDLLDEPVLPVPPIGENPFQTIKEFARQKFIPSNEKYVSPATVGTVTFDYTNNDGRYSIGSAELMFELKFTKSGSGSIHIYNDPQSIRTIAIAKNIEEIKQIKDARDYDSSSRSRTPRTGQIIVLQNANGFYAAIQIIDVKYDHTGTDEYEVTFSYVIQTNGSPDFTL